VTDSNMCEHCTKCNRTGLPILFGRYAAAFSHDADQMAQLRRFAPTAPLQTQPGSVACETVCYNVRMLREGFLYLLLEMSDERRQWRTYRVHPHGYLSLVLSEAPDRDEPEVTCERGTGPANRSLVWLDDTKKVRKLWFAFHPDPIDHDHLTQVIEPNCDQCMQSFDVQGWIKKSACNQRDSFLPGELPTRMVEYAALDDTDLQEACELQHYGLMGVSAEERQWGDYEEERYGRHFVYNEGGAAFPADGFYSVPVQQPGYAEKHQERLHGMQAFLEDKENDGVVLVCEDAIGIAQEISLHHLTAGIPYAQWLEQRNARHTRYETTNHWKISASESVTHLLNALHQAEVNKYDDKANDLHGRIKIAQDRLAKDWYPTERVHAVEQPDGSMGFISPKERAENGLSQMKAELKQIEQSRSHARSDIENAIFSGETPLCDKPSLDAFAAEHKAEQARHEKLVNGIGNDLLAWLQSDALIKIALGRYNPDADIDKGDGIRFAGQVCAILQQIDNSQAGRLWLESLELFTPDEKNLVWRMLSYNNKLVSEELVEKLDTAFAEAPPHTDAELEEEVDKNRYQDSIALFLTSLSHAPRAANRILQEIDTIQEPKSNLATRIHSGVRIAAEAQKSTYSVLMAAAFHHLKKIPASSLEQTVARWQALLLTDGLGGAAMEFFSEERKNALGKKLKNEPGRIQRQVEKVARTGLSGAIHETRISCIAGAFSALAIYPALIKVVNRRDERAISELGASLSMFTGLLKQARVDFYNHAIYKNLPDSLARKINLPARFAVKQASEKQFLKMKIVAARYVAAGAVVAVAWDAWDAVGAFRDEERSLAWAYVARGTAGVMTVWSIVAAARYPQTVLWIARLNIWGLALTVILTILIAWLKRPAWQTWFQRQPFCLNTPMQPHRSEADMGRTFIDALQELKT